MKQLVFLFACFFFSFQSNASDCYDGRYESIIFDDYKVIQRIQYGYKQKTNGVWDRLRYDVYLPKGDTVTNRPVIMLSHGGGFLDLFDQTSPDITRIARDLATRGYVVLSIDYRQESNPLALADEQKLLNAQLIAHIDIRDVHCHLIDTTLNHGNPFGIDLDKVIIGGVSAGSMANLNAIIMDSTDWIPEPYLSEFLTIEPNLQSVFDDKFCGMNVLGMINISGSLVDTAFMRAELIPEYPALLHIHGTADPLVPFGMGEPFIEGGFFNQMGSSIIQEQADKIGLSSQLLAWPGASHVPFFGFEIESLFSPHPFDFIFESSVLFPTLDTIAAFCYRLIDCNEINSTITGLDVQQVNALSFFPNPSNGQFRINLPSEHQRKSGQVEILNSIGQVVFSEQFDNQTEDITINENLENGYYSIIVAFEEVNRNYTGQLVVIK